MITIKIRPHGKRVQHQTKNGRGEKPVELGNGKKKGPNDETSFSSF